MFQATRLELSNMFEPRLLRESHLALPTCVLLLICLYLAAVRAPSQMPLVYMSWKSPKHFKGLFWFGSREEGPRCTFGRPVPLTWKASL